GVERVGPRDPAAIEDAAQLPDILGPAEAHSVERVGAAGIGAHAAGNREHQHSRHGKAHDVRIEQRRCHRYRSRNDEPAQGLAAQHGGWHRPYEVSWTRVPPDIRVVGCAAMKARLLLVAVAAACSRQPPPPPPAATPTEVSAPKAAPKPA